MENAMTKDDLRQFRLLLLQEIREMITAEKGTAEEEVEIEWLRSKAVREILNISPNTLQNLRVSGAIRFRKVMGSYYYNKSDLMNLFKEK